MANIFAIITAVLLAASAYIAFKNKGAYTKEIADRQSEVVKLDKSKAKLKGLQDDRDQTIDDRKGVEEATIAEQEKETAQKDKNSKIQGDIQTKQQKVQDNGSKIDEIEEKTKEIGEISEIAGKITTLSTEIQDLKDENAVKDATLANLIGEKNGTENAIAGYQKENSSIANQKSYFSSTRITAIFGSYGFVTLGAGNSTGVVSGSRLDVVRGGETVGRLHVRSVEAGRASADIIPDSLAEDVVLMVGDRVVPTRENEAGAVKATAAN